MKTILFFTVSLLLISPVFAQSIPADSMYLVKTLPDNNATLFFSGITERICISSDGKDIFYSSSNGTDNYHYSDDEWSAPKTLFNGFFQPSISTNDSVLYVNDLQSNSYFSIKNDTGWSSPVIIWNNNTAGKHHLQVTNSGTFYATTDPVISSRGDISKVITDGTNLSFQSLPSPVNSTLNGVDFYISKA